MIYCIRANRLSLHYLSERKSHAYSAQTLKRHFGLARGIFVHFLALDCILREKMLLLPVSEHLWYPKSFNSTVNSLKIDRLSGTQRMFYIVAHIALDKFVNQEILQFFPPYLYWATPLNLVFWLSLKSGSILVSHISFLHFIKGEETHRKQMTT